MGDSSDDITSQSSKRRTLPIKNPYLTSRDGSRLQSLLVHHCKTVAKLETETLPASNGTLKITPNHSGTNVSALVIAASHKAGMDGIDRAKIDSIILKASGNSLFMQQQKKRDEKVNQRIAKLREKLQESSVDERQQLERQIDAQIPEWISNREVRAVKVVVDMDMFYMACELLAKPHLKDVPAVVGGPGMISTSNYAARRFGVRSAMPGYIGEALVDELSGGTQKLVYCKLNFDLYKAKAKLVREALSEYDPNLSAYSLDEAYLDISHYLLLRLRQPEESHVNLAMEVQKMKDQSADESAAQLLSFSPYECRSAAESIVQTMRRHVQTATGGLTCSAGLAPNFLLAKIASDRNKPDGQLTVDPTAVDEFLRPLPVRKISGIGRVTEKILDAFGISTVEQLYQNRALVAQIFDPASSSSFFLLRASVGCASSDGQIDESESSHQKGISRERTFTAEQSWSFINEKMESIAIMLSNDMADKDFVAGSMSVKVKLHTFDCFSRSRKLPPGTFISSSKDLAALAATLLQEIKAKYEKSLGSSSCKRFAVRLLGVRCSNLAKRHDISSNIQTRLDEYATPESKLPACHNPYTSPTRSKKSPQRTALPPRVPCPICTRKFNDEAAVSRHIDTCLNEQESRSIQRQSKRKRTVLTDFFTSKS